ncbi:MAG: NAD-dependent epimerase/dehydratase family protein [Lachnospiraceae bacterium]|nr:NAD-dependent epimerase/dehydratase family protein [Lachnospiraceae bacterium]
MNHVIRQDIEEMLTSPMVDWSHFRDKTVLVTGAYGMLASYMVYPLLLLNEQDPTFNCRVLALGRNRRRMEERFGDWLGKPYFVPVYEDAATMTEPTGPVDYIIHAASPTNPRSYLTDPSAVIAANVSATESLLKMALRKNTTGFLFVSSGEVYGVLQKDVIEEEDGGTVTMNDPRNVYALSKRLGELLTKSYAGKRADPSTTTVGANPAAAGEVLDDRTPDAAGALNDNKVELPENPCGLRTGIVRPSHTYGPTMDLQHDGRVFADFVADAVAGRDIVMTGDGLASRAFIYASDAVLGYYTVLLKGENGAAYNVTNNDGIRRIRDLAECIAAMAPTPVKAVFGTPDAAYKENANKKASIRSIDRLLSLGWRPVITPEEGFARTIRSFLP